MAKQHQSAKDKAHGSQDFRVFVMAVHTCDGHVWLKYHTGGKGLASSVGLAGFCVDRPSFRCRLTDFERLSSPEN